MGSLGQTPAFTAPNLINGISIYGAPFYTPGVGVSNWLGLTGTQCTQSIYGSSNQACLPASISYGNFANQNVFNPWAHSYGPGSSEGNEWRYLSVLNAQITKQTPGIAQTINANNYCLAVGDCTMFAGLLTYTGGQTGGGDQGPNGLYITTAEAGKLNTSLGNGATGGLSNYSYFACTVTTTTGTGDTEPACSINSGHSDTPSAGLDIVDVSKLAYSGNYAVTNTAGASVNILGNNFGTIPVTGVTLPTTSAFGQLTAALPWNGPQPSTTQNPATNVTITLGTNPISSAKNSFTTGWATVVGYANAGQSVQTERVYITAGATVSGVQTISFVYRHSEGQAYLFQGGPAGNIISQNQNLAMTGLRTTYKAVASFGGSDLVYAVEGSGCAICARIPALGVEPQTQTGGFQLFPYAEIVQNLVDTAVTNTTSFQLEGNNMPITVGDVLEGPDGAITGATGVFESFAPNSPCLAGCYAHNTQITGLGYGGSSAFGDGGTGFWDINNAAPLSSYYPSGGPLTLPHGFYFSGAHNDLANFYYTPPPGGTLIGIQNPYPTSATFTASLSSGVLNVTAVSSGAIVKGQTITGSGFTAGIAFHVTGLPTGCYLSCTAAGTYYTDNYQTISSETITAGPGQWCLIEGYDGNGFSLCHEPSNGLWLVGGGLSLAGYNTSAPFCQPSAGSGFTTTGCNIPASELPAASTGTQGAVIMPAGSSGNTLGTAAAQNTTGSGAAIPTGPTTTTSGDGVCYSGTTGQQADCGYVPARAITGETITNSPGTGSLTIPITTAMTSISVSNNFSFTMAAGAGGQTNCIHIYMGGAGGYTVTAPSNVIGWLPPTGAVNSDTLECMMYSGLRTAWIVINP